MKNLITTSALICLTLSLGFLSCTERMDVDQLDLDRSEENLVVEGWIYDTVNTYSRSYVRLSRTTFYAGEELPPAVNRDKVAFVQVIESGTGDTISFLPDASDAYNWYPEDSNWVGKPGNSYRLRLSYEGHIYTAEETLNGAPQPDALSYEFRGPDHPQVFDVEEDTGYYFFFNGQEPCTPNDFYRFKAYQNGQRFNRPQDLIFVDDGFLNGNYIGELEFPTEPYRIGDTAYFEMLRITEDAFRFYAEAQDMIGNGGLFANPHYNVRSNVETPAGARLEAVGFFGAAGIESYTINFTDTLLPDYQGLIAGYRGKPWKALGVEDSTFWFYPNGDVVVKDINPRASKCYDELEAAPTLLTADWSVNAQDRSMQLGLFGQGATFNIEVISGLILVLSDPNTGTPLTLVPATSQIE